VQAVGQPVDDRDGRVAGELLDGVVAVGADHHRIDVAGKHPCRIPDLFPPPELHILGI
jgi:hypothetical protein